MLRYTLKHKIFLIISITTIVRLIIAWSLELGNDEVYYWSYAKYPDLSHFDHPPMLGWFIQLFSLNLFFDSEVFIRLSAIITGAVNTWIIYVIVRRIKSESTGIYAAILYSTSLYSSIICNTFILPDSPQSLFFLLSIYFLHEGLFMKYGECRESSALCRFAILLSGVFIGLATLSKYSSLMLWGGTFLYIFFYDTKRLRDPFLYIAVLLTAAIMTPVIIWNYQNDFISFSFHTSRIDPQNFGVKPLFFFRELFGTIIYNNPVNFFIILIALISFKRLKYIQNRQFAFFFMLSVPVIIMFLLISLFRETLPHWSAPAYYPLMIIAASYLAQKKESRTGESSAIKYNIALISIVVIDGFFQIKTGLLTPYNSKNEKNGSFKKIGEGDFTLDMYGWRDLGKKFKALREQDLKLGIMHEKSPIVTYKWFPAAHYDYYVAKPSGINVKTIGEIDQTHKYAWITQEHGSFRMGESSYLIISSREHFDITNITKYFKSTDTASVVYINRLGKPVERFTILRLKEITSIPPKVLVSPYIPVYQNR